MLLVFASSHLPGVANRAQVAVSQMIYHCSGDKFGALDTTFGAENMWARGHSFGFARSRTS